MVMRCRATEWPLVPPMKHIFKVSEKVIVDVQGFEPWPATVESVVCEEELDNVSYYVKLDGASETVPIKKENIKQLGVVDAERYKALSPDELWHGARKRMEVIQGVYISMFSDGDVLFPSWRCRMLNSNYEKVPDVDKANLELSWVADNARIRYEELKTKFTLHAMQNRFLTKQKNETDGYRHIVENVGRKSQMVIRFPCPMCSRRFKTRMALKKHLECNPDCTKKTTKISEQPRQCPKCFSLYKNDEVLLKHMAVHEKNLPKKKNGIRDYLRQIMSNNKASRVPSFVPIHTLKSKASVTNGKSLGNNVRLPDKKVAKLESPEDSEQEEEEEEEEADNDSEDNTTCDTDSFKTVPVASKSKRCRVCRGYEPCKCNERKKLSFQEIHSKREKVRRKQMKEAFENLAAILDMSNPNLCSKNALLQIAREEIQKLEDRAKTFEQTLADLRDMNMRLDTRRYQLSF